MPPNDEELLAELIAVNEGGGGLLDWSEVRSIARTGRVSASLHKRLGESQAGRKLRGHVERSLTRRTERQSKVFLAHSFHKVDAPLVAALRKDLRAQGLGVVTGERPSATYVSAKVLSRIDSTFVFVGLFTCSPGTNRPSPWLVSELGYVAKRPRVVLLEKSMPAREMGGIQGDLEYLPFERKSYAAAFKAAAKSAADAARKGIPKAAVQ